MAQPDAVKMASIGTGILSIGTILGCLCVPLLAERIGRKRTLAIYFAGMFVTIATSFGWAFYLDNGLWPFIATLFLLGFFGGNFAVFSLWLPEQYDTNVRATAFAFSTSIGRFIGAGVNFGLAALVVNMGTIGKPVALTSLAFLVGLALIPFAIGDEGSAPARLIDEKITASSAVWRDGVAGFAASSPSRAPPVRDPVADGFLCAAGQRPGVSRSKLRIALNTSAVAADRFAAPDRIDREQQRVTLAETRIDDGSALGDVAGTAEQSGDQKIARVAEADDRARTLVFGNHRVREERIRCASGRR